jgi:hypothetical protein
MAWSYGDFLFPISLVSNCQSRSATFLEITTLSTADSVAGAAPPLIRRSLGAYDLALVTAFMML